MRAIVRNRWTILVSVAIVAAITLLVVSVLGLITIPVITPDRPKHSHHHVVTQPHKRHSTTTHKAVTHKPQSSTPRPGGSIGVRTPLPIKRPAPKLKRVTHPKAPKRVAPKKVAPKPQAQQPSPSPQQSQQPTQTTPPLVQVHVPGTDVQVPPPSVCIKGITC